MAVPKRRQSNSKTGQRRAHDHKEPKAVVTCPECSSPALSHAVCPKCGYYNAQGVVAPKEKKSKGKKKKL